MVRKAALVVALVPSLAAAQTTSNTNCFSVGNTVQCNTTTTQPPPPPPAINWNLSNPNAFNEGWNAAQKRRDDAVRAALMRQRMEESAAEESRQETTANTRKLVSTMIANGYCANAIDTALRLGELGVAAEARSYCDAMAAAKQK